MPSLRSLSPFLLMLGLIPSLAGCKKEEPATWTPEKKRAEHEKMKAHWADQAAKEASCQPKPEGRTGSLRWYEDDFEAAVACAKKTGRPLLLDLWAPWCHTCLSMQQTVFSAPAMKMWAHQFIWVAVDTDRPDSAPVTARFPPLAWPTFYVLDPDDLSVRGRHVGGASPAQIDSLLDAGLAAEPSPAREALRVAAAAEADGDWSTAAKAYGKAIAALPKDAAARPDFYVAKIRAESRAKEYKACLETAATHGEDTGTSASAADLLLYAHRCGVALDLMNVIPGLLRDLSAHVERAVSEGKAMSVDDRSDALRILREVATSLGDADGARKYALRQKRLLDETMKDAPPEVVMTFGWPAAEVYTFLGEPAALVPTLEAAVKALPEEYDPPYRLAWVLLQAGRADAAAAPAESAAALAYGPRKVRVLELLARIHAERGDEAGRTKALQAAIDTLEGLPASQRDPDWQARLRAELP